MKRMVFMTAVAAGLAMQAFAAVPNNNNNRSTPTVSTKLEKVPAQKYFPYLTPKTTTAMPQTDKINRVGNISSRPWAQTVGFSPGPNLTAGDREMFHDVHFSLFSVGAKPN